MPIPLQHQKATNTNMKKLILGCLFLYLGNLPAPLVAQDYKNAIRLNTLNFFYKGIGVAYERKTFERQSISLEYSLADFRTANRESKGLFDFSNTRWKWSAIMVEYRFYLLDMEEIENFNMFLGLYGRYAHNIAQNLMSSAGKSYGKTYQKEDAYWEAKNSMWGGGLTFGYLGQLSPKFKIEMWSGLGLMRILKETVVDDRSNYLNYPPEVTERFRWNPRMGISVGYCF
jgi:hypothetical protein